MNQSTVETHRLFDLVWKQKLVKHRGAAYAWMRKQLGVTRRTTIKHLTEEQCEGLICKIYESFPILRDRKYFITSDPFRK